MGVGNPRILGGWPDALTGGLQMPRGGKPLWLGANNPTPGLRKTLTAPASGAAARARSPPCGLGACALGAPACWGKSVSSAKVFEINFGARTRNARPGVRGDARGDPQNPYLSGFGRRLTACLPGPEGSSGEIYLLRRRGRKNQAGGLRIRLRMAMARAHLAPFLTTSTRK